MTSEFPAGLSRPDIESILNADDEVRWIERIDGAKTCWRISYSANGRPPIEMLIDNRINDLYVQVLARLDVDHIVEALTAVAPFGVVGMTTLWDGLFMRSSFFIEHSTMHAFTNSYRSVALAYLRYQEAITA